MLSTFQKLWRLLRRHPLLAVGALAFVLLGTSSACALLGAQYHLHAGQRALERFAFDEAQHHLDLHLKVHFRSAAVHLLAAQTARRRDAYEQAENHLAACLQQEGMTEAIALERLLLTAQQGDLDGVEGLLKARTGADDLEAVLVLEALAKGYMNRFWQVHALVCLNILLERQPQHPQALLLRARVFGNLARNGAMEREEEALRDYQKAVELNPSFEARLGLAGTLFRVGRPWDALLEYEQLHQAQPRNPEVLLGLARCRYSLHDVDTARQLLDELLEQNPPALSQGEVRGGREVALLEQGRLALHAGQLAEAEKWLRQAVAFAPPWDSEPHRLLYQCLQMAHKDEEARQCLDGLREREANLLSVNRLMLQTNREPHNVALRYEMAMKLICLGRLEDGLAGLFFVLDQEPRYGPAHEALADYFERTGQSRRAARHRRASSQSAGATTPAR